MASQFQFVMRSGPTPGATFPLEGEQLTIGRDSSNGVAINDPEVSRKHSRLTFQGGKYVIEDLGSTNGTFVNGQRATSGVVLKSGDIVSLGEQIVMMFEALSGDPGATVAVSRKAAARPAAPAAIPAQPSYSPAASGPAKKTNLTPVFIGVGVLLFICLCVGAVWYIDANYMWCNFWRFAGCP